MSKNELLNLKPRETMLYKKSEGVSVQWMFMGIDKDGKYQLYGLPFTYEDYLILNHFEIVK